MPDSPLPSPVTDHTRSAPQVPAPGSMPIPSSGTAPAFNPTNGVALDTGRGYVGLGGRFLAGLIDGLILAIPNFIVSAATAGVGSLVLCWLYFAIQHSSEKQATFGQRAMGMVITDDHGDRISFGKASGQYFGSLISSLILLIGYIMIAFTEKHQGLHDKMAGTLHYYNAK